VFRKVLIANRGEIALRVLRACREVGVAAVTVHSEADRNALHVRFADESICIGPAPPQASYLNQHAILSAADISGADAVHPGYGFLAENPEFAEKCERHELRFIGPSAELIRLMGNKIAAKALVAENGVPLVPGSEGAIASVEEAAAAIDRFEIPYPVLLKAAAGGGGRGMKVVRERSELARAFAMASEESTAAFGDGSLYLERYFEDPRHIEIQVFGDGQGRAVHLGERECSVQRRHQKIIEEARAPNLRDEVREAMYECAVRLTSQIGYASAGTVEFLVDDQQRFYFIEMNTRIQVEHPVTEFITGVDLVRQQLLVGAGEGMTLEQSEIQFSGHSIECRINAEDPWTFAPSPGLVSGYHAPGGLGVRVDSAVHDRCAVRPFYDSMLAKLIVHGQTRSEAVQRMRSALAEFVVAGIRTNVPLHQAIMEHPDFRSGTLDTGFVQRLLEERRAG
jgi:acetyl-CoA carboxylase biotin carboxylase subunit